MVKKGFIGAFSLTLAIVLSGCAVQFGPIDHKAQACSTTKDILEEWTAVPASEDFSDLEASNAVLAASLAAWKSDDGATDPTFKLLSKYAGKLLLFLAEGSPSSAKGLTDFEQTAGAQILNECRIFTVDYIYPLEIVGGFCWTQRDVNAELQEKHSGEWVTNRTLNGLERTSECSDVENPYSLNFQVTRGFTATTNEAEWDREYRIVWTNSDGSEFSSGANAFYSCATANIRDYSLVAEDCS